MASVLTHEDDHERALLVGMRARARVRHGIGDASDREVLASADVVAALKVYDATTTRRPTSRSAQPMGVVLPFRVRISSAS